MKILVLAFLFATAQCSNTAPIMPLSPISNIVIEGDSISAYAQPDATPAAILCAAGSTHNTTCWADVVATTLNVNEVNYATGGKCLTDICGGIGTGMYGEFATTIESYCTGNNVIVIMGGSNDFLRMIEVPNHSISSTLYESEYVAYVNECIAHGISPNRIFLAELPPVPGSYWGTSYYQQIENDFNAQIKNVVTATGVNFVPITQAMLNACSPISGLSCYWDTVHPNVTGDALIAAQVEAALGY